ncbi:MAG: hypothetical protein BGP01_10915 [Paludibacter sp. 47-17]|nr:MAG: hypothetical protein BGP01_10915 [Paludibacter sp. 47-17]
MKTKVIILSLMVFCFGDLYSQNLTDSLLVGFFNRTFNDYFGKLNTSTNNFYVLKDSIPENVTTDYPNFKLHFVDYSQTYPLIKKGKISTLFWAKSECIGVDTVDITIGAWTTSYKRVARIRSNEGKWKLVFRSYQFGAWCGGTLGYIPQGRFIFDPKLREWEYISEQDMINEKRGLPK